VGIADATSYEVVSGLQEGEMVALPGDVDLRDGMYVIVVNTEVCEFPREFEWLRWEKGFLTILLIASAAMAATSVSKMRILRRGGVRSRPATMRRAIQPLQAAAAKDPRNGDVHLLLAKSLFGDEQLDAAIRSAERPWLSIRRVRHNP